MDKVNSVSRFDYVKYDEKAVQDQEVFKNAFMALDGIGDRLKQGRAKSTFLTKLEEAYMWVGKAIRDDQIERNKGAELQEGRTNS